MIWVDYVIIILLIYFLFKGLLRGLGRAVFALALFALATWVGLTYDHAMAHALKPAAHYSVAELIAAFCILFFLTLCLGLLVRGLFGAFLKTTGLSLSSRLTGMIFGAAHAILMITLIVLLAGLTPLPQSHWWQHSTLLPPFQTLAHWLKRQSASEFNQLFH